MELTIWYFVLRYFFTFVTGIGIVLISIGETANMQAYGIVMTILGLLFFWLIRELRCDVIDHENPPDMVRRL